MGTQRGSRFLNKTLPKFGGANRLVLAHERQDAYTLSDATAVAANRVDSGRISLGPRLRYAANDWSISLAGDLGGIGSGDFTSYTGTGRLRIPLN